MSIQVKRRRGAATNILAFTGAQGEIVVDITNNRMVAHDGSTMGGFPAAKLSEVFSNTTVYSANLVLASPNGSSGALTPRALVAADLPSGTSPTVLTSSATVAASALYVVTTAGITVTLPGSPSFVGSVSVKAMTGTTLPNITIAGNVDGSAGGTTIRNFLEALTFTWSAALSTWVVT